MYVTVARGSHNEELDDQTQPILALLLLVLRVYTDDHNAALAANDLALLADRLYRRSYLHDILPPFLKLRNGGRDADRHLANLFRQHFVSFP